jgi:hypothetical protein|tara:strand:- start:3021 stop:3317 length:297 start_codon:yes stop_codon:yes gene_type:complete
MKKKKIITIDEFFRLKQMLSSSEEDQEIAFEIYSNQYKDRNILDPLMHKALLFKNRKDFQATVKVDLVTQTGKALYIFLAEEHADEIYKQILDKLMND